MKNLDELNKEELLDLAAYIQKHPHLAAKRLFKNIDGRVKYTRHIMQYCWNKYTALHQNGPTRSKYISIAVGIWSDLPVEFHLINIDLVPRREIIK
jgi:hypothetical protein